MLKKLIPVLILLLLAAMQSVSATDKMTERDRPNVLFIAIDDMNDWAGFLDTHPQIRTPHMDSLAAAGVSFTGGILSR